MTSAFDTNPEFAKMREELASRKRGLMFKQGLFAAGGAAVGALTGGIIDPKLVLMGGMAGAAGGGLLGDYVLSADRTRIGMDEEFARAHAGGNRNWDQYREQVVEKTGHGLPSLPLAARGGERGRV